MLFGGQVKSSPPPETRRAPARKTRKSSPPRRSSTSSPKPTSSSGSSAAAQPPAAVEKSADAQTVLVLGDFMADGLADGLSKVFADNPNIKVESHISGSSGLVRDDHYDWPASVGPILDEEKPSVAVVMIGSNDRQSIMLPSGSLSLRTEAWTDEYRKRATALAEAISSKGVPLVWVGVPAFKFERMSEDMVFFNGIYGQAAANVGGEFVDVWDGFVDADGAFVFDGPDLSGQPARLRNSDGITLTNAGKEKLAFFAEKAVLKHLDTSATPSSSVALAPDALSTMRLPPLASAANATSKPSVAFNDPALDGGDELLGGTRPAALSLEPSPRDRLVVLGSPVEGIEGRADNFSWNAKEGAVAPPTPAASIVARGSVGLDDLSRHEEPKPMPSLDEAIVEDWANQAKDGDQSLQGPQAPPSEPGKN
ncbi:SGNH/GDSL hydrolase family protein [Consotaella salsifontis]|nr:SGNH family hydrolase [Consotaella salsifontis]